MILLDTSALVYFTLDPQKLTEPARTAIEKAQRVVISSITLWELALKVKKYKLDIPLSITDYILKLKNLEKLEILDVDIQAWLENLEMGWDHRDPVDRTMVALAKRFDCPLVTSDHKIAEYYEKTIW